MHMCPCRRWWNKQDTSLLSQNINAFLNTGKGGAVHKGIIDDEKVKGICCNSRGIMSEFLLEIY